MGCASWWRSCRRHRRRGTALRLLGCISVDVEVGGFGAEPDLAAFDEVEVRDRVGGEVDEGGWAASDLRADSVGEQFEAGDHAGPDVAGAGVVWPCGVHCDRGWAYRDQYRSGRR